VSDRTEDPTPRRLRQARTEGDSGASSHAAQAVAFVLAVAVVPSAVRALASEASSELHAALGRTAHPQAAGLARAFDAQGFVGGVMSLVVPALLVVGVAGAMAHVAQTGGTMAGGRLTPRLDRLDPIAGAKALLSSARVFAVGRAFAAALLVGWLAYRDLSDRVADVARVAGRPGWASVVVADVAGRFAWHAAAVGLALGLLDFVVTRRAWLRRLRMTREEVKREHKESEGDPTIRAARHRAYQELLAQTAIANVKTATVVVVNPTHLACALRYDAKSGDDAPVVVASGEGDLAARIAQAAREWGVPIVRDVPLAQALVELGAGDVIPEALYEVVAEILRDLWEAERPPA
jgi:flagellar biosynthesis protein FlhB